METVSDLEQAMNNARNLPHLLVDIPPGELTPEVKTSVTNDLQAQLNDLHVAEKLGRAFMLGRLHRFLGVQLAAKPPLDTVDECNLYAGGYQYDEKGEDNPILNQLIAREDELQRDNIKQFVETKAMLDKLIARRDAEGLSIELMDEMFMCRASMQALTTANLISRLRILEARFSLDFIGLGGK